ncbi:MAG: hypothetical protein PSV46_22995 [Reyranella sp.]|nr:hypothetical protein [Reyranella sp.]
MSSPYVLRPNLPRFLLRGLRGYAWSSAKNVVKKAIGRKAYFTPLDDFFRRYLGQRLGGPRVLVTCCLDEFEREGAGSQAFMVMSALNFARALGCTYVHTPFVAIDHADRPLPEWIAAWEALFNFGVGERLAAGCGGDVVNFGPSTFVSLLAPFLPPGTSNDPENDPIPLLDATVHRELQRKYRSNKQPLSRGRKFAVCVHVRRFNRHDNHNDYFMPGARMARTLGAIEALLQAHRLEHTIRIFSQGPVSEFPEFVRPGVELVLDADPVSSLQEMIAADILVTSQGSFSYMAAVLCEGIVVCEPSMPPQDGWIACADDGAFDIAVLGRRLP